MPLAGTFSTMPLPDVLQWLHDSRRTGWLSVSLEFEERFLRVEGGQITAVASDDARSLDLGPTLLALGLLDPPRLARARLAAERTGRPLAEVAQEEGVDPERLDQAIAEHARRALLGLFLWREGRFHFSEGAVFVDGGDGGARGGQLTLACPIDLREVLMEGIRRLDEWQRIVAVFPSDYCQVHALGHADGLPILDELLALGEPVALGELWARQGADRYQVYEELFQAWRRGLLAVDAQVQSPAEPSAESPVDALVRSAGVLIGERQYEEAAPLLHSALDLDPFRQGARDLQHRARDEQLAELYQLIPPYHVPVLAVPRERLARLNLDRRERAIAGRINGRWDVGALVVLTPIGELETMRALKKLIHLGAIRFAD
ncbi:MAG: DUF4388 domain-containing protein [Myxococcales bacterium]|nr:DUF4388 domain-containing protein [Myxococcales bacterium]